MPRRRLEALGRTLVALPRPRLGDALRSTFQDGYGARDLRADVLSGLVVGIVALPLSMALAIAVGATPERGLYTAIVAGIVIAALGGSRFQVCGPTAAFIVILAPIVVKFGIHGLLIAGVLAGLILIAMGLFKLGRLIEFIPHPVTTGFTAGIAVVIATLQAKDLFGLKLAHRPEGFFENIRLCWEARRSSHWIEPVAAAATLVLLVVVPKLQKRIPAPLVAIGAVTAAALVVRKLDPSLAPITIPAIPRLPPHPESPWGAHLDLATIRTLLPSAFAIAMLGAIESLLSAVIADAMTGKKHDPDAELIAQGVGNVISPFFGGIPATGALARTATNIRAGARSPISSMVHGAFVLVAILVAAPLLSYVPMASLGALLLLVAWNMSEARHFRHILAVAPKSDVAVLLVCFGLTVFVDMVYAVSVGVLLAALLFMRRMAELTEAKLTTGKSLELQQELPAGVAIYSIQGPLFFGAAARAMRSLTTTQSNDVRVVIIYLGEVPAIDATGLVGLESAIERLTTSKTHVVIAGPLPQPRKVFDKAHLETRGKAGDVVVRESLDEAIRHAERFLQHIGFVPVLSRKSQPPSSSRRPSAVPTLSTPTPSSRPPR